jgi:hypothetical protein
MFDELERLRANEDLRRLLAHYAELGESARDAWQDRLMEWDRGTSADLVRLHGLLLAHEWVELNVGVVVAPQSGAMPACYRVTAAGLSALRRARERPDDDEESLPKAA